MRKELGKERKKKGRREIGMERGISEGRERREGERVEGRNRPMVA